MGDAVVRSERCSMAEIVAGSVVSDNVHASDDKYDLQEDLADSDFGDSSTAFQVLEKYVALSNKQRKKQLSSQHFRPWKESLKKYSSWN